MIRRLECPVTPGPRWPFQAERERPNSMEAQANISGGGCVTNREQTWSRQAKAMDDSNEIVAPQARGECAIEDTLFLFVLTGKRRTAASGISDESSWQCKIRFAAGRTPA
jgi:hypothetical protein